MQLPPLLRAAIDQATNGLDREQLNRAAQRLSHRYRAEVRDGAPHIDDATSAIAYAVARLPATFAAIGTALAETAARTEVRPATMLDAGAGPGTALWAASEAWSSLAEAEMIEKSGPVRTLGEQISASLVSVSTSWIGMDAIGGSQGSIRGIL
jgi:ribosomal protein RSM22 (predicted rRNA methylase)